MTPQQLKAMKLALEALELLTGAWQTFGALDYGDNAIAAIKEALAQPEQEPVAWMHIQGNYQEPSFRQLDDWEIKNGFKQYPLYTTPPQRTWVGLTDEDCQRMGAGDRVVAMWADRTLKEKNT